MRPDEKSMLGNISAIKNNADAGNVEILGNILAKSRPRKLTETYIRAARVLAGAISWLLVPRGLFYRLDLP